MSNHEIAAFWQEIIGEQIPSQILPGVFYRVERFLGGGGMSVALFAVRLAPEGETPIVLKILSPELAIREGQAALLTVAKEAVALGRLNDRVPTTPFVVRYIDSGNLRIDYFMSSVRLPWVAIEYVHGGSEGTTLEERIQRTITRTGYAFDPERAAQAVECLAEGLVVIHEVGIIHRDMKPSNVLCSGQGNDEIHKIADFGIARPVGMKATFGAVQVGTLGYASPEQLLLRELSTASDVFGLAAVCFHLLTGENYFDVASNSDAVELVKEPARKHIANSRWIHPDLKKRALSCAAIDFALKNATAYESGRRTSSASLLAQMIVPALRSEATSNRPGSPAVRGYRGNKQRAGELHAARHAWTVRRRPDENCVIRSAAWDGGEHCMMVTSVGLAFWDGINVRPVVVPGFRSNAEIQFVLRTDAGTWLVGGTRAQVAVCSRDGAPMLIQGRDSNVRFVMASGDIDDIIVFVGISGNDPPTLHTRAAARFMKPVKIDRAASVTSLSRLDDLRWLVTGRSVDGDGFVAIYEPLQWEVRKAKVPPCRAYLASAASSDGAFGMVVGTDGVAARFEGEKVVEVIVTGQPDLSAVAIDADGHVWMGSSGTIWMQKSPDEPVRIAHRSSWMAPFVAIHAGVDRVLAISATGGILEGRECD
ncbi:MAG TPA: serine/threonine-protein kinase [Polyangium sp.]|nr:serine/threonine-protein kinase [Polyangium sp.]